MPTEVRKRRPSADVPGEDAPQAARLNQLIDWLLMAGVAATWGSLFLFVKKSMLGLVRKRCGSGMVR